MKQGIRCNASARARSTRRRWPAHRAQADASARRRAGRAAFIARQPMGRLGTTAEEFAAPFVFLASDESSFTTGQAIFDDGGMSL